MVQDSIDKLYNKEKILDFWFSERVSKLWYQSTSEFDREVESEFSSYYNAACEGSLNSWQQTARGSLALVILFDQYPLNVFRGDQQCFTTEKSALHISEQAVKKRFDELLSESEKSFIYIPYMHSEDPYYQELSVALYKKANLSDLEYAQGHQKIIQRFGRFPHRNKILGRESTDDEISWLNSADGFNG